MKTFSEYSDEPEHLDESFLRGASTLVLMNHIHQKRKLIARSKQVDAKTIDALASMILASASLTFTSSQFPPETKKGN